MGAVTDTVKRYVPSSYRELVGATNSYDYSITDLQALADFVKFKLFGTAVAAAAEATFYDPLLVNFVGKLTTLQFIPAAVDFWGRQISSQRTLEPEESVTYPDARTDLWKLFDKLAKEVGEDMVELGPKYGFKIYGASGLIPQVSYGDNGRGILVTSDPQEFGPAFDSPSLSDLIPWSEPS